MCISVFPACTSVYLAPAWHSQRLEESIECFESGVTDVGDREIEASSPERISDLNC